MSVITFFGSDKVETSQTTSMAAIATYLSIENNFRILLINAKYNDTSFEELFWDDSRNVKIKTDLETGTSGLIKAIASNKISPAIITNYTRTIFKERLELLTDNQILKQDFERQKEYMKNIIKIAKKFYDLVFIDLEGSLEEIYIQQVLKESDLIVANTSQRIKIIKEFIESTKNNNIIKKENTILLIGRYDKYSKYNAKNLQRMQKVQDIYGIPYNTLFFEACNEGTLTDFIINYRRVRVTSINWPIMSAISEISEKIIEKLKKLQMQV